MSTTSRRRRLPDWRLFTWAILAFNLLMVLWIVVGAASVNGHCAHQAGVAGVETAKQAAGVCQGATDLGAGIAIAGLVALWVAGDVILGVLWLVTRPRGRECPACGTRAKRGVLVCRSCGHDFGRAATSTV